MIQSPSTSTLKVPDSVDKAVGPSPAITPAGSPRNPGGASPHITLGGTSPRVSVGGTSPRIAGFGGSSPAIGVN